MEATRSQHWWSAAPARQDGPAISAGRAYLEVLGVFACFFAAGIASAGFVLSGTKGTGHWTWASSVPGSIDQVTVGVLSVIVPLLLLARRGRGLADLGLSRGHRGTAGAAIRMVGWGLLALIAFGLINRAVGGGTNPGTRTGVLNGPALLINLLHGLQAGFIEEFVVLGFVVVTLEQARRPRYELVAVALVLRASYHIYYGPGVLGILVWASVFLWLFLRNRTLLPLIALHSAWDVMVVLTDRWHGLSPLDGLLWLGIAVAAPVSWLVARSNRNARGPSWPAASPEWWVPPGTPPGPWPGQHWPAPPPPPHWPPPGASPPPQGQWPAPGPPGWPPAGPPGPPWPQPGPPGPTGWPQPGPPGWQPPAPGPAGWPSPVPGPPGWPAPPPGRWSPPAPGPPASGTVGGPTPTGE